MSIKIDQAFTSLMLGGSLGIDIVHDNGAYSAWDGVSYTSKRGVYKPQARREFMEMTTFQASKAAFSLADTDDAVGFYQCILKYPADVGAIIVKQKAEQVLNLLKVGSKPTYAGQKINIISNNRDGGRVNGGFYEIVIRANYRAFVTR